MASMFYQRSGDIPVVADADVVVVGGGPGGTAAAVAAARQGADTVLVERYGALGGMASFGEVTPFTPNHANGRSLARGIYMEWCRRMRDYLPECDRVTPFDAECRDRRSRFVDKNAAMLALEDLCLESGVRLLYHHELCDVAAAEGRISGAVFHSKSGFAAVTGKVFVDATGDGDLAVLAGSEAMFGNDEGFCQPMTTCFKLSGIDRSLYPDYGEISRLYNLAKAAGEIDCPRENVLWFETLEPDTIHYNTTRIVKKSGVDALELSEAEIEGRRQVRAYVEFLRRHVPGCRNARLASIAHQVGVRESRRIRGLIVQTAEDFETARKYPDAVARVSYPIDIHNPSGTGTVMKSIAPDEYYEISYRAIVPHNSVNFLMGCRAISVDHTLHSSCRVMPPVCAVGEGAGIAAAMLAAAGCGAAELDGRRVNAALVRCGAL